MNLGIGRSSDTGECRALTIRAEMARRGLLGVQRQWYEDPDSERLVDPKADPDTIAAAWEFISWLEGYVHPSAQAEVVPEGSCCDFDDPCEVHR